MVTTDLNWQKWIDHGDKYLKSGTPKEGGVLGPEIKYNMLSMSLEAYTMAILDYHGQLPENHTYSDLMYALDQVQPLEAKLRERILKYENIQSICSVEKYARRPPSKEELADLYGAIIEVSGVAHATCYPEK